ncbi:ATPase family AAA domain-containing protein 3 [Colletotrichum tropicale]|nr:ATPase family AAA domain-containing protein 3 [Colletotrichum tropicale]
MRGVLPNHVPSHHPVARHFRTVGAQPDSDVYEKKPKYRPHTVIDWRRELCRLLHVTSSIDDGELLDKIGSATETLRKAEELENATQEQGPPRYEILYKITCFGARSYGPRLCLDAPRIVESGPYNAHLQGTHPINNFELHMERNKEITFIVYRHFECCGHALPEDPDDFLNSDASSLLKAETITLVSEELSKALEKLAKVALYGMPHPDFGIESDGNIAYPYLWWFHRRNQIAVSMEDLRQTHQKQLAVFEQYIQYRLAVDWQAVDTLLADGRITAHYIEYLFVPNRVLISKTEGSKQHQLKGLLTTSWLKISKPSKDDFQAVISVSAWEYRGEFYRIHQDVMINKLPKAAKDGSFSIETLAPVYPSEYTSQETLQALRKRGHMFWKCRHQNYVSSSWFSDDGLKASADARFMVDYRTYSQMHPESDAIKDKNVGPGSMHDDDSELDDEFYMCLPTSIPGFNMQKKEWVRLDVEFIEDVQWNEEAFEYLVIDDNTKELVKAVVMTQLRAEENTDLIRGKGNGLFILLHGGPGTGKTLTAESVAEIAKKPLYRVTCGDIGTKAEDVEGYLETVLLLGKTWGCVVLLDEADVFLEERSLQNLERNALVSVFLRVLEYYDGILILTSNRVGTFDEAFKSRIQLNLRYSNLSENQRLQIWTNFINRIEGLGQRRVADTEKVVALRHRSQVDIGINADEIRTRLRDLAKANLNGREIRNAISTARQLAVFRGEALGYEHIARVIGEARKFDDYLKEVSQGYTADDIRRGKGER